MDFRLTAKIPEIHYIDCVCVWESAYALVIVTEIIRILVFLVNQNTIWIISLPKTAPLRKLTNFNVYSKQEPHLMKDFKLLMHC